MVIPCWLIIITVGRRKSRRFIVVVEGLIIDLILVIILVKNSNCFLFIEKCL